MTAPTALLKPALEAVMQVARQGEAAEPTEPAPAQLRRYLRFARLPAPALDIARRVVEEDDAFRERVAQQLTEDDVGEAGWLWLSRPDGWEERLEELRKHQQEHEHALHEERAEREAHRRLSGAEDPAPAAASTAPSHERTELAKLIGDAATAAEHLSGALAAASQLLAPASPPAPSTAAPTTGAPPGSQPKHLAGSNRVPLRLPPGISDESVEAVEH